MGRRGQAIEEMLQEAAVEPGRFERLPLWDEGQARLAAILEATTDFVVIADTEGRILHINEAGRQLMGLADGEEATSGRLAGAQPDWVHELIWSDGLPTAMSEGVWSGETAFLRPDGRELPVSQVILIHRSASGDVEYVSTVARDISERKRLESQLAHLADHDPLTGLYNRRRFERELERHRVYAARSGIEGAVFFLDLDHFKHVNDSFGHAAGNELLISAANHLSEELRGVDVLARLGGDEFAILVPDAGTDDALALAERLLSAMREHAIIAEGRPVSVTASIGVALLGERRQTVEDAVGSADRAMYEAKEAGRDRVVIHTAAHGRQARMRSKRGWDQRIREALDRDQFVLHCQPIMEVSTGETALHEVLLRMTGMGEPLIQPGAFLETAERFGLIHAIDRWVVRKSIGLIAGRNASGHDLRLTVNISGKSVEDTELLALVQDQLEETGIDPAALVLEVTETAAIANISQARRFAQTLRALGCRFALDDFGVGFATFANLKHLPIDLLKIDGDFIENLVGERANQLVVRAMVDVAKGMGIETVAEYVPDARTLQLLGEYGIDYAQGDHVGQPRAAGELWPLDEG